MATLVYLGLAGVLGYDAYLFSRGQPIGLELQVASGALALVALYFWRSGQSRALYLAGKIPRYNELRKR
jgi:hypothetical protein